MEFRKSKKIKVEKNKEVPQLAKCGRRGPVEEPIEVFYEKKFLLHLSIRTHRRWFMLNISSKTNAAKEVEEISGIRIPNPSLRGVHLSFHHEERHAGATENPPPALHLVAELVEKREEVHFHHYGRCYGAIGTTLYSFGGYRLDRAEKPWSRKVRYYDMNHPDEGWKKGRRTVSGRANAAIVCLNGKIFVFGGCRPDDSWAEFLEEGGREWSTLELDPPSGLGYEDLFACVSGENNILVGSKHTEHIYLYNVSTKLWNELGSIWFGCRFFTPPIVVGSKIIWISCGNKQMNILNFGDKMVSKLPIGDYKICHLLGRAMEQRSNMNPNLLHLVGDVFCLVWEGDDGCLHCTTLRVVSTTVYVLCCHHYKFERSGRLLDCLQHSLI